MHSSGTKLTPSYANKFMSNVGDKCLFLPIPTPVVEEIH